jgi:hypothetical protein
MWNWLPRAMLCMLLMLLNREGLTYMKKDKVAIMGVAVAKEGVPPKLGVMGLLLRPSTTDVQKGATVRSVSVTSCEGERYVKSISETLVPPGFP